MYFFHTEDHERVPNMGIVTEQVLSYHIREKGALTRLRVRHNCQSLSETGAGAPDRQFDKKSNCL